MAMPGIGGGRCLRACERIGASDLDLPSRDARLGTRIQVAREVIKPPDLVAPANIGLSTCSPFLFSTQFFLGRISQITSSYI